MKKINELIGLAIYLVTDGRIITSTARAKANGLRKEWANHCEMIQRELDEERERGWGFRYCDGRRIDF